MRVLKPGGRMAFYVIHTADGLSEDELTRAQDSGPDFATPPAPYRKFLESTGFVNVEVEDVTHHYHSTIQQLLLHADDLEAGLRKALGDDAFEERRTNRTSSLRAVEQGLLARSLVVGEVAN